MMRFRSLIGLAVGVCLCFGIWKFATRQTSGAQVPIAIERDEDSLPLVILKSERPGNQSTRVGYNLTNLGGSELNLKFQGVSCGCTYAEINDKKLVTGDVLAIASGEKRHITLHSNGASGDALGVRSYFAQFLVDDGISSSSSLALEWRVSLIDDFTIEPTSSSVNLDSSASDDEFTIYAKWKHRSQANVEAIPQLVEGTSFEIKSLDFIQKDQADPENGLLVTVWRLDIRVLKAGADQSNQLPVPLNIQLKSNGEKPLFAKTQVMLRRTQGVESPKLIYLRRLPKSDNLFSRFALRSRDGASFIRSVNTPSGVETRFSKDAKPCQFIEVEIDSKSVVPVEQKLIVVTTHPGAPSIELLARSAVLSDDTPHADVKSK